MPLQCPTCRYDLSSIESDRCPECGETFALIRPADIGLPPSRWPAMRYIQIGTWVVGFATLTYSAVGTQYWYNFGIAAMLIAISMHVIWPTAPAWLGRKTKI